YNLVPALPVYENAILPLRLSGKSVDRECVKELLEKMNFAADLNSFVNNLSGGERQKVAIAWVLLTEAKVIFADEPTGAVDSISKKIIFELLNQLVKNGACVVMVTHDIELASKTDRTIILKDGMIKKIMNKPISQDLLDTIEGV
ncbi:ATP-binding cassette domain-containing protein, partial [Lactobacillus sp. XV13L]|nr:ATP-binding cassette domain-containing protein [Lactobacillus sp. XV13L]